MVIEGLFFITLLVNIIGPDSFMICVSGCG